MKKKRVELVAPAGNWSAAKSAVRAGCDSVYFGLKDMNMRAWASNFDRLEVRKLMAFLHNNEVKGYLTLNVPAYDNELSKVSKILSTAGSAGVDAVILWDMGILDLAKKSSLPIHLSTQAGVSNFRSFKFYSSLGVSRIVLARECSLRDIENIKTKSASADLSTGVECFVHGAMCSSISGRCYLSHEVFQKSANRGECIQPCRRKYRITDLEEECEYILGEDYVLSAKDLCTINFLDRIIESGADALKIEGRMRSPEYVRIVTETYREAIDSYYEGSLTEKKKKDLFGKIEKGAFSRGFSGGFYKGRPNDTGGRTKTGYEKVFLGEVKKFYGKIKVAEIKIMNGSVKAGDTVLVYGKKTPASFAIAESIEKEHESLKRASKGDKVGIKIPFNVRKNDKVFLWKEAEHD